tara:strand:- start:418 stop:543 length:126 start_codon:yes stop_codon:yes gene_type:complete
MLFHILISPFFGHYAWRATLKVLVAGLTSQRDGNSSLPNNG